jgi:hypothetical protein
MAKGKSRKSYVVHIQNATNNWLQKEQLSYAVMQQKSYCLLSTLFITE